MKKIIVIACSQKKNLELAQKILREITDQGHQGEVLDLVDQDLPLYTPKKEADKGVPQKATNLKNHVKEFDGMVVVAPEYNGGVPPVLISFIAWLSVGEKDCRACFNEKPGLMATHSGSGGAHLFAALRIQLSYIGMNVLGRTIHTHYQKELKPETLSNTVSQLIKMA